MRTAHITARTKAAIAKWPMMKRTLKPQQVYFAAESAQKGKAATIPIVTVVPVRFIAGIFY